jgi:Fungal N-terminal domain of STAND proteins
MVVIRLKPLYKLGRSRFFRNRLCLNITGTNMTPPGSVGITTLSHHLLHYLPSCDFISDVPLSMSVGINIGEFLSAIQLAWTVYIACKDAPHQFKALSEEVEALHIVLESIKKVVLDTGLDPNKINDLNRVSRGCVTVLTELDVLMKKYKSLGTAKRKTWDKLRWSQEDIEPLRGRLTSNVSLLTAFNASLLK